MDITDYTLPAGHYFNALFRMNKGLALFKLNRYDESEQALLAVHTAIQEQVAPNHPQLVKCSQNLVMLYEAWGKPQKAAPFRVAVPPPAPAK